MANAPSNRAASPLPLGRSDVYEQRQPRLGAADAGSSTSKTNGLLREARWATKSPHDVSRSRFTLRSRLTSWGATAPQPSFSAAKSGDLCPWWCTGLLRTAKRSFSGLQATSSSLGISRRRGSYNRVFMATQGPRQLHAAGSGVWKKNRTD